MQKNIKIKVCGLKDYTNIVDLSKFDGISYLGFIFYDKSKRFFSKNELPKLPKRILKTGVFVDKSVDEILAIVKQFKLDAIQLHGDESVEMCGLLKTPNVQVIKVFSIGEYFDFQNTEVYQSCCDLFLFDAKGVERGGNGVVFNWSLLEAYKGKTPFFLSGGLGVENLDNLNDFLKRTNLPIYGIDINSKFEISFGFKDCIKIKKFIENVQF